MYSACFNWSAWMLFLLDSSDVTCISQTISKSLYVNNLELVLVTALALHSASWVSCNELLVLNIKIFFIEAENKQEDNKEEGYFLS